MAGEPRSLTLILRKSVTRAFSNGYNRIVQKIEFNCGLAYGTLSDPQVVDKTAEEIISSKQRSYATVKAIQNSPGTCH